jgi:cyclohexanecarboxylate-CoA ligase
MDQRNASRIKVLSLYGRSENLVTTRCSTEDDVPRALTSDGSAPLRHRVRIVDPQGEVPAAPGDITTAVPPT